MFRLHASGRLHASESWFDTLSNEQKKGYLAEHPDSKYAHSHHGASGATGGPTGPDHGRPESKTSLSQDDHDRIAELKKYIKWNTDDVADLEADGEDASNERRVLKDAQEELNKLLRGS